MCKEKKDSETEALCGGSHYGGKAIKEMLFRKQNRSDCRFYRTIEPFFRCVMVRTVRFVTFIGKQMCPLQIRLRVIRIGDLRS